MQALKDEPGDELQVWGSGKLLQTLLQHELVDRFQADDVSRWCSAPVAALFNDGILGNDAPEQASP